MKSLGNITLVVDNLEKRGLIVREKCLEDRRYVWVKLTNDGSKFISELFPMMVEIITDSMIVLSPFELEKLGEYCKQIGHNAQKQCAKAS